MINFKPYRDGFVYNSVEEGKGTRIEIYYSKGGANYFSGGNDRRGIYVSMTPVELEKRISMDGTPYISSTMCLTSGIRAMIVSLSRLDRKAVARAAENLDAIVPAAAAAFTPENRRDAIGMLVAVFQPAAA